MTHPSLAEELERKCLEELERIMLHLTQRRITIQQAQASLLSLWNTTSGLVSNDTMDLVAQSAMAVNKQLASKVRHDEVAVFQRDDMTAVIARVGDTVSRQIYKAGVEANSKYEQAPATETVGATWANARFQAICLAVGAPMTQVV